jgi:hypothetical protein
MLAWDSILRQVRSGQAATVIATLTVIREQATLEDLPLLYQLAVEPDWLVRDIAIEIFSRLEQIDALPTIIRALAMDRGNHDFDGVSEFTGELVARHPTKAMILLQPLLSDVNPSISDIAQWALLWIESANRDSIDF